MNFIDYGIGNIYPEVIGCGDSVIMDLDDCGVSVNVLFNNLTDSEISQFNTGMPFEMRLIQMRGIIFGLFKFGNLNWMDAPYNVHLSRNLTKKMEMPADGTGLAATILLYDTATGKLCKTRMVGLSDKISREFIKMAEEQRKKPFNMKDHFANLKYIYASYPTNKLVKMAPDTCHFRLH